MPSVSRAQARAMAAAAEGKSTLGIPKSVGQDFVTAQHGHPIKGLPEHVAPKRTGHPLYGLNTAPTLSPKQKAARALHHTNRALFHASQALQHLPEGKAAEHMNTALDALDDCKSCQGGD